jgi:predicted nucleic acid-binding protein
VRRILDADVLIGALDAADAHHSDARALFIQWHDQDDPRLISVVNLAEVLIAPGIDARQLRTAREAIGALGVVVHQPSEAVGVDAARLRGKHPISLPDAFCLATARHAGGAIASFDRKVLRAAEAEQIALVS